MHGLLTVQEVADRLRTTPATVRYWRHQGLGPRGFRLGRRVVFREEDVAAWINQRLQADSHAGDVA